MQKHILQLLVTRRCNLHCRHCYWLVGETPPDPPAETIAAAMVQFERLARSYGERGRHVLNLSGGEPTLRGDLAELIRLARSRGFAVRLSTNAVDLDLDRARDLARAGLSAAQVSLDGAEGTTYEAVRGAGLWTRAITGVMALRGAGIPVVLSMVLLPGVNIEEAPRLLDLAVELGAAGVKFARPVREGALAESGLATEGDFWQAFRDIMGHACQIGYRRFLFLSDPLAYRLREAEPSLARRLPGLVTDSCDCRRTRVVEIAATTGDVFYCRLRQRLGNLAGNDLVRLWRGHPVLAELRFRPVREACRTCRVWTGCQGGCPAIVAAETGRLDLLDGACPGPLPAGTGRAETLPEGGGKGRAATRVQRLEATCRRVRQAILWQVLRRF